MSLRKNRIPLQGLSNFRLTQSNWSKNMWNPIEEIRHKNINPSQNIISNTSQLQNITKHKTKTKQNNQYIHNDQDNHALTQIRKRYKHKINVWRIAKAWKFDQKGFITAKQLKQKIKQNMNLNITDQDQNIIKQRFGNNQGKIDLQNFLKILYNDADVMVKPKLYDVNEQNKLRQIQIDNLIDKLKIYQKAFEKNKQNPLYSSQKNIQIYANQEKVGFEQHKIIKRSDQKCKSIQKCHARSKIQNPNKQFNEKYFFSLTQQSFSKLRSSNKQQYLHPQTMLNQNQTKTRFGATVRHSTNQTIFHKQYETNNFFNKNIPIQSTLQKNEKKIKMINRIQKIRQIQKQQKQNIQRIQNKQIEKFSARLDRKKLQKQAYEYSAFIRNKWL